VERLERADEGVDGGAHLGSGPGRSRGTGSRASVRLRRPGGEDEREDRDRHPATADVAAPSRRSVSSRDLVNTRFPARPSSSDTRRPLRFFGRRSNWKRTRLPVPTDSAWYRHQLPGAKALESSTSIITTPGSLQS